MTVDERDPERARDEEEPTAADRAAEPEGTGGAGPGADRDPSEDAPLVSEEGVNEGATDMVREHPAGEPTSEGD